jgi:2-amino-4-hydroxy-6-hydroxymethyldihydropteridine diphosphokinase
VGSRRVRTYIGLGANLGDAAGTLADAVRALSAIPGARVCDVSRLYVTAPWGVTDQPDFHNAAVAMDVRATDDPATDALALLADLKRLEREAGRSTGRRWGPRVLDLDLLIFGRHHIRVERPAAARSLDADADPAKAARPLEVPHRDAGRRLFVLAPLADLAPGLVPPGWAETIATRRRTVAATEPSDSVRAAGTWDPHAGRWH